MKKSIIAVLVAIAFVSGPVALAKSSGNASRGGMGVSNIENQTKIFERTDLGKERADWSKGRVVEPGKSVQCWNENLMRGGIKDPACKK